MKDDNAPLASVEVYNPLSDDEPWTCIRPMASPRGGVGLAPLSGKLIAVGGHNGKEYLKSVEIYDIESDSWEQGPPERVYIFSRKINVRICECLREILSNIRLEKNYHFC